MAIGDFKLKLHKDSTCTVAGVPVTVANGHFLYNIDLGCTSIVIPEGIIEYPLEILMDRIARAKDLMQDKNMHIILEVHLDRKYPDTCFVTHMILWDRQLWMEDSHG